MGKFIVELTEQAREDIAKHKRFGNKAAEKKIKTFLNELQNHPYTGSGQPEPLKYELQGYWSRRINQKDRMVYSVNDNTVTVEVVSAIGHYLDK